MRLEDLPHGGGRDCDAERGEFTVDSTITSAGVLTGQAQDEGLDRAAGPWAAGALATGDGGVAAADEVAVPAQNGVRGDDQMQLPQPGARKPVQQSGEESAVCRGEAWFAGVPLQDGELVAQRKDLMSLSVSLIGSSRMARTRS
jgi:hypothetical protein